MKNNPDRLPTNISFLLMSVLLAGSLVLWACSHASPTEVQDASRAASESADLPAATPIPNPRAEEILAHNFRAYVNHIQGRELTISPDELAALMSQEEPFLIDLRKPLEVKKTGYIPGAILIPLTEMGRKTSALPDLGVPIIIYCQKTSECMIALTGLGVFGWDIRVLAGGFEAWTASGNAVSHHQIPIPIIDPFKPAFPCCGIYQASAEVAANPNAPSAPLTAATDRMFAHIPDDFGAIQAGELEQAILSDPGLVVIDLRPEDATRESGQIQAPNFMNIPFEKLIEDRERWPEDKSTSIVVYSQDGDISPIAMTLFWIWGYQNTRELQGGFAEWTQ